ncbi:MAG: response regulator receiver protein, partial [Acidobacteria bacterium]|nr:response regulator receiver protein [Acidobacteriota bacterium]
AFLESPEAEASDCLVVDVQMPGMSGPELQQALLRRPRRPPMVFMTAFPNAEVRKRVLAAGAIEVLGKPCDAAALSESIEAALASR